LKKAPEVAYRAMDYFYTSGIHSLRLCPLRVSLKKDPEGAYRAMDYFYTLLCPLRVSLKKDPEGAYRAMDYFYTSGIHSLRFFSERT
jgi:hypothetical protein